MSSVGSVNREESPREDSPGELQVLVFDVADQAFGIDVARVREILPAPEITPLPQADGSIRGVFQLRGQVVPCVSLADHLGIGPAGDNEANKTVILTDFNGQPTAFLADRIERIHRLSWWQVWPAATSIPPERWDEIGLAPGGGRRIAMLDFEAIVAEVADRYFRVLAAMDADGSRHSLQAPKFSCDRLRPARQLTG